MTWLENHLFILILLALYLAVLIFHAWEGKKRTRGVADFFIGGRSLGGLAIGLSFFATYSSTNSFIGFAGQGYTYGLPWLLLAPFVVVFSLLAWIAVAPRIRVFTRELDSLTIPDFFGFRFESNSARILAALIVLFASLFYMAAVYKGIANALESFLDIPYWMAVLIVFVIVVVYTAVGGFISVVKTDVVQGFLLIIAALFLFEGTVRASGGLQSFMTVRNLPEGAPLFSWDAAMPFPILLGILFAGTIKFVAEPRQLSRFYALKDHKAVRKGMWISTLAFLVVYTLLVPIGIYARNIFPSGLSETDQIVPRLLVDPMIFHPAVSAFILVALLGAAMSSLDSVLLVAATTFQRDVVGLWRRLPSDKAAVRETGVYVALFALITTAIALNPPGGIVSLTVLSGSLYAACFIPGLILGLYWRRGNGTAAVASFAAGIVCLLFWRPLLGWLNVHEVFPALGFATLIFVVLSLAGPPTRVADRLFGPSGGKLSR